MDMLQDLAECELPEVFYGKNLFFCTMPARNLIVEISPIDSIALSGFKRRDKYLRAKKDSFELLSNQPDNHFRLN